jgi:hypothetical protein
MDSWRDEKSARMRDSYRAALGQPDLGDREIDEMRQHVMRLGRAVCEHVWGKRFY